MIRAALLLALSLTGPEALAQTPDAAQQTSRSPGHHATADEPPSVARNQASGDDPAQPDGPVLGEELDNAETLPGRPVTLRLTVLVPTFLPEPPEWPSLEMASLLVRLPERSGGPTSERIGGKTWSAITRAYRLDPLVPGAVTIPPQEIGIVYAGTDGEKRTATLRTEAIAFRASVPAGAEDLDPFIAADALSLQQRVEGNPAAMTPGDSVVRSVTARIEGAPPMLLPPLLAPEQLTGVAAYADETALEQTEARGVLSGARIERMTYVAEGGGGGGVPPVAIRWWNVAENRIETARAEGFQIAVDGPPARSVEPRDWRRMALTGLAVLSGAALARPAARRAGRSLMGWAKARRAAWQRSERYAWRRLMGVVGRRDYAALHPALDAWAAAPPGTDPRAHPALSATLNELGRALYGSGGDAVQAWQAVAAALPSARRSARRPPAAAGALPPLNPSRPSSPERAFT